MEEKKSKRIIVGKAILTIAIIILIGLVIWQLSPYVMKLYNKEGQIAFKDKVDSLGWKGFIMLFGLQVLQIILVVLPGEPLEVLAGMCYGTLGGLAFICFSVFITTIIIYFAVRKYGKKLIYYFFKKDRIEKIENSKLFKDPKKIEFIICLLFFIPGTPKDLLIYLGGLLPIKPFRFIMISTFVRLPSVISSTIAGANLSNGNWRISVLTYVITFIITGIVIYIANKRNKTGEDFVEIMK